MRTYTINLTYDVTVDAESTMDAQGKAYRWLMKCLENPDVVLPDDVWSVRCLPKFDVAFVGGVVEALQDRNAKNEVEV